MTNYQQLISKIRKIKKLKQNLYPYYNFSPSEIGIILDALETIQFLEIIFKERIGKEKLENHESH